MSDIKYSALYDEARYDESGYDTLVFDEFVDSVDVVSNGVSRSFFESVEASDSFDSLLVFILDFFESVGVSDEKFNEISRAFSEVAGVSDDFSRDASYFRSFSDGVSVDDSVEKTVFRKLVELVESVDTSISRGIIRDLHDLVLSSDDLNTSRIIEFFESVGVKDWEFCSNLVSGVIETIRQDFDTVLNDLMNEKVDLVKVFEDKTSGFVDDISETRFCITCRIMPVSQQERNMLPVGKISSGSMKGYFYPSYDFRGETYKVEMGDEISDGKNNVRYRVEEIIERQHLNDRVVYVKALLKRI